MPIDQLAIAVTGLANGLAVEELSDPRTVSDELLSDVLVLLVSQGRPAGAQQRSHPVPFETPPVRRSLRQQLFGEDGDAACG
jgi:hypothetical protein